MRKPPAKRPPPPPPGPEGDPDALDGRLFAAELERRRKRDLGDRFREGVEKQAKGRGEDPYALLAQAIRKMLREG